MLLYASDFLVFHCVKWIVKCSLTRKKRKIACSGPIVNDTIDIKKHVKETKELNKNDIPFPRSLGFEYWEFKEEEWEPFSLDMYWRHEDELNKHNIDNHLHVSLGWHS